MTLFGSAKGLDTTSVLVIVKLSSAADNLAYYGTFYIEISVLVLSLPLLS